MDIITKYNIALNFVASDFAFPQSIPNKFWINCNDTFGPGSDAEDVDLDTLVSLWEDFKQKGWPSIIEWVKTIRKIEGPIWSQSSIDKYQHKEIKEIDFNFPEECYPKIFYAINQELLSNYIRSRT